MAKASCRHILKLGLVYNENFPENGVKSVGIDNSYIYSAIRTPIGKFKGALSSIPAPRLAACAMRESILQSGVSTERITDVILGNVLPAGLGQAPARQATLQSGLSPGVRSMLVNKVCGSGLQAVVLADSLIRQKEAGFVVAGGMENMSEAPILHSRCLDSNGLETSEPIDSLVFDGLWDSFSDRHMGAIGEALAQKENISREEQDQFALESYRRARAAQNQCLFAKEIVPVSLRKDTEGNGLNRDEQPYAHDLEKLTGLASSFLQDGGTVTAGNSSSINDGAAALVVGPYDQALNPMARIVAHTSHSMEPELFPLAPVYAIQKLVKHWSVPLNEIDLFEINEAFAVTALAVIRHLGLPPQKVNVRGGAVALGHPIGASGARILVTLLHALQDGHLKKGIAAICIGGGEALALGVEMMDM